MNKFQRFGQAFVKLLNILKLDKGDVLAIYWLAAFSGLLYLALPLGIQAIVGFVASASLSTSLVMLVIFVLIAMFLNGALQVKQLEVIEKVEQKIFVRYAYAYSSALPVIDLQKNDDYYLPELVNRFFDVTNLQKSIYKLLLDIPASAVQILIGTILLAFYHPVFIAFGIVLLFIVFAILRITSPLGFEFAMKSSDYKYAVGDWLEQISRNIRFFKFNNVQQYHITRTDELLKKYIEQKTKLFKILKIQYWSLIGFKLLIFSAMLILGVSLLVNQQINVGQFVAADIVIIGIITSVEKFIISIDKLYEGLAAIEKLNKITEAPKEESGSLIYESGIIGIDIKFQNVSFQYNDNIRALDHISFHIQKGEWVQLRGDRFSGKTSIFNLISGSYMNFEGQILINDIPIRNYDVNMIRHKTGVLFKGSSVIEGSILQNICLGDDHYNIDYVLELSKETGLWDYIKDRKEGFDEIISPYRNKLPSNVIHSILLTRALYNKPNLLLLEDPFIGMNEAKISRLIEYMKSCNHPTVIIINNDNGAVKEINKIISINDN